MSIYRKLMAVALVGTVFGAALADESSDFKKWHASMGPKVEAAFAKKDYKFFEQMVTKDFKMTENGKTQNKNQAIQSLRMMFMQADTIVSKMKQVSASAKNGKGMAEVSSTATMTMKPDKDKKVHKMVMTSTEKQVWLKKPKGWKLASIETVNAKYTMDGKPFDPSKEDFTYKGH